MVFEASVLKTGTIFSHKKRGQIILSLLICYDFTGIFNHDDDDGGAGDFNHDGSNFDKDSFRWSHP